VRKIMMKHNITGRREVAMTQVMNRIVRYRGKVAEYALALEKQPKPKTNDKNYHRIIGVREGLAIGIDIWTTALVGAKKERDVLRERITRGGGRISE
jgi:hypothetical protein